MARYIDAERLRDRVKIQTNPYGKPTLEYASGLKVLVMIDQEPTADVVEVVRCKDCKHCHEYQKYNFSRYSGCDFNGEIYEVEPNHFCSYGERRAE